MKGRSIEGWPAKVRRAQGLRGLSRAELAKAAGFTPQRLGNILKDAPNIGIRSALAIARALEFPVELLFDADQPIERLLQFSAGPGWSPGNLLRVVGESMSDLGDEIEESRLDAGEFLKRRVRQGRRRPTDDLPAAGDGTA